MLSARFGEGFVDKVLVIFGHAYYCRFARLGFDTLVCITAIRHFAFTALARLFYCMH